MSGVISAWPRPERNSAWCARRAMPSPSRPPQIAVCLRSVRTVSGVRKSSIFACSRRGPLVRGAALALRCARRYGLAYASPLASPARTLSLAASEIDGTLGPRSDRDRSHLARAQRVARARGARHGSRADLPARGDRPDPPQSARQAAAGARHAAADADDRPGSERSAFRHRRREADARDGDARGRLRVALERHPGGGIAPTHALLPRPERGLVAAGRRNAERNARVVRFHRRVTPAAVVAP